MKSMYTLEEIELIKGKLKNRTESMEVLTNGAKSIVNSLSEILFHFAEFYGLDLDWKRSVEAPLHGMENCFVCVLLKFLGSRDTRQLLEDFLNERDNRESSAYNLFVKYVNDSDEDALLKSCPIHASQPLKSLLFREPAMGLNPSLILVKKNV